MFSRHELRTFLRLRSGLGISQRIWLAITILLYLGNWCKTIESISIDSINNFPPALTPPDVKTNNIFFMYCIRAFYCRLFSSARSKYGKKVCFRPAFFFAFFVPFDFWTNVFGIKIYFSLITKDLSQICDVETSKGGEFAFMWAIKESFDTWVRLLKRTKKSWFIIEHEAV